PPPVGSIVTYRYQELSDDGVPRFPSYVGVRHDIAWPPPDAAVRSRPAAPPAPDLASGVASAPAPRRAPAAASETYRRTFVRGDTRWAVEPDGRAVKVCDEQPGQAAETTTRRTTSPAAAWRDAERMIAERLAAGYIEIIA